MEAANNYCYIASKEFIVAETATTISFSDIPDYFDDLVLIINGHTSRAYGGTNIRLTFNDSTGAKYCYNNAGFITSTAVVSTAAFNSAYAEIGMTAGTTTPSHSIGITELSIYNYTSTLSNKNFMSRSYRHDDTAAMIYYNYAGSWYPTTPVAINKITLQCGASYYFDYPTKVTLYGVKL